MNRRLSILVIFLCFMFCFSSLAMAGFPDFPIAGAIFYEGMVNKDGQGLVTVDTGIFVANPNAKPVKVWIMVFNKDGEEIYQGPLYDHYEQRQSIPAYGFNFITLGMVFPQTQEAVGKYTYAILWDDAATLPLVVEVKEVIYNAPVDPKDILKPSPEIIKSWSETALGGKTGTCVVFP